MTFKKKVLLLSWSKMGGGMAILAPRPWPRFRRETGAGVGTGVGAGVGARVGAGVPRFRRPCRRVASDGEEVGDQTTNADVSRSDFIGLCIKPPYEVSKKKRKKHTYHLKEFFLVLILVYTTCLRSRHNTLSPTSPG